MDKVRIIPARQAQARRKHDASPMPLNLLNALASTELRDLLAFLEEVE